MHAFIRVYDLCMNSVYTCVCVCVCGLCTCALYSIRDFLRLSCVHVCTEEREKNREREIDEKRAVLLTPEEEFKEQLA